MVPGWIGGWTAVLLAGLAWPGTEKNDLQPKRYDWPQWQGSERTAISRENELLPSWPTGGPRLLWKVKGLGEGFSTPSVATGRIFTMGNRGDTEYVIALDDADQGKELWAAAVGPVRSTRNRRPGPRCTPTVDGDRVYALGLNGDLLCLEAATGKERWRKDLVKDLDGRMMSRWGYSESPLVDGARLICT